MEDNIVYSADTDTNEKMYATQEQARRYHIVTTSGKFLRSDDDLEMAQVWARDLAQMEKTQVNVIDTKRNVKTSWLSRLFSGH